MRVRWSIAVLVLLLLAVAPEVTAQGCAMCKAVVDEGNAHGMTNGSASVGAGLNKGIIIMMVAPYILLFFAFRKKIIGFWKEFSQAQG